MDLSNLATENFRQTIAVDKRIAMSLKFSRRMDSLLNLTNENSKTRAPWLRAAYKLEKTIRKMSNDNLLVDSKKAQALMSDVNNRLGTFLTSSFFGTKENERNFTPVTAALLDLAAEVYQENTPMDANDVSLPVLPPFDLSSTSDLAVELPVVFVSPNSGSGPKVLFHVIRHGQATHNIVKDSSTASGMFDPPLTSTGEAQCQLVQSTFPNMRNISLVLCSPSYRARQTALIGFKPLFDNGMKMHLWNKVKEWGHAPCNGGWNKDVFMFMNNKKYDVGMLEMDWNTAREVGNYRLDRAEAERSKEVRAELHDLSDVLLNGGRWHHLKFPKNTGDNDIEVLIVSHGGFLSSLLRLDGPKFSNAQYRTTRFPSEAELVDEGSSLKADDLIVIADGGKTSAMLRESKTGAFCTLK